MALRGTPIPTLLAVGVVVFSLCAACWTDLTLGRVFASFTVPGIVVAASIALIEGRIGAATLAAIVFSIPFAATVFATKGRAMGWGEVGLIAIGALLLDPLLTLALYSICFVVGPLIALARGRRNERLAISPYLSLAIGIGLLLPTTQAA